MLIHLGMSGRMAIRLQSADHPKDDAEKHEHLIMETDEGWRIGLIDPRRFGLLDLMPTEAEDDPHPAARNGSRNRWARTSRSLCCRRSLAGRRTPIKAALLDQRVVAGLGNIYVSEALFRAGISPHRLAGSVPGPARRLGWCRPSRTTLREAIDAGGSSLRDYVQPDGELGYFQHEWKVYGRAGIACERCPGATRLRRRQTDRSSPAAAHFSARAPSFEANVSMRVHRDA